MTPRRLFVGLSCGLLVALVGIVASFAPALDVEERFGLAALFELRGPIRPPSNVVVLALDETSERDPSRPRSWPRWRHAELVKYLSARGARLIVFDLTFESPSADPREDESFAAAMRASGRVLLTQSLRPLGDRGMVEIEPVAPLAAAALGYAPFLLPKEERVNFYWSSFVGSRGAMPTLPVLAHQLFSRGEGAAYASERALPAQATSRYLNFYGPTRTIATLPYAVVSGWAGAFAADPADSFRDKAVFIGYSAATLDGQDRLRDNYRTVFSQRNGLDLNGVEIAATAFANLVTGSWLRPLGAEWHVAFLTGWGIALGLACCCLRPLPATLIVASAALAYMTVAHHEFSSSALWLPIVVPLALQAPLAGIAGLGLHYFASKRERDDIRHAFGHFLPNAVVDQLTRNMGQLSRRHDVVFGACLASDVEGYTAIAEQMEPSELGQLMNAYFAELFVPVERSQGVIVDIVGDAMVAVWAQAVAPRSLRANACRAALDIAARLESFNTQPAERPLMRTRLGLHAGDMVVGSVGASGHFEYRAVGDIVNTASRIQGLNKVLGTQLLASSATVDALVEFTTRPLGEFLFAGKSRAVEVVELVGPAEDDAPWLLVPFADALASYRERHWALAAEQFGRILEKVPDDGPSLFYLGLCRRLADAPPAGAWHPTIHVDAK